ncbi:MAG: hypothetical protein KJ056_06385 [Acidimicrobiia bacterium]|nr:hypothetical protein [Acidimicrobiia bacterium]
MSATGARAPARTPARAAAAMGVATAVSRAFGFVRVLAVAAVLGTTYLGNAFQSSNSVSNVIFELLAAGALSAVLVPTFVGLLEQGEREGAEEIAGGVLGLALAGLGVVTVVGVAAAPLIARLLTTGVRDPVVAAQQQDLTAYLLRFFIPQVMLYAVGAVAIAVLYARRRFVVTAVAPIGNTVAIVAALAVFSVLRGGAAPSLDLTTAEKITLGLGGTLGVLLFVTVPTWACWHDGFRLRPRWRPRDRRVRELLGLSGWAVLQHAGGGLLLAAALVVGNGVAGGVVAFQVAMVFFLAPYAILAQPIHTAILPDLSLDAARGDLDAFGGATRWALDGMAVLVVPVAAGMIALAEPAMRAVAFGRATTSGGVDLLAAGLASLALGLFAYGAFLLLARAYYALGDSRTPAVVGLATAVVGVGVMAAAAPFAHGAARVAVLGFGHSAAYVLGAGVLGWGLSRRTGVPIVPRALPRALVLSTAVGGAAWVAERVIAPGTRGATTAVLVILGAAGGAAYAGLHRLWGGSLPALRPKVSGTSTPGS